MIDLTNEYRAAAKEFKRYFGYGVPLSMIPQTANTEELIVNIKSCIENSCDNLLSRYGIDEKNDTNLY